MLRELSRSEFDFVSGGTGDSCPVPSTPGIMDVNYDAWGNYVGNSASGDINGVLNVSFDLGDVTVSGTYDGDDATVTAAYTNDNNTTVAVTASTNGNVTGSVSTPVGSGTVTVSGGTANGGNINVGFTTGF